MSAAGEDIPGMVRQRRLAAILVADISGYSRLMGADEEGTLSRMRRNRREIIDPAIFEHHGRLVNAPGDSLLAVFDSPLEAVRCALVVQQSVYARNVALPRSSWLQYRIGVNLGDIIVEPSDGTVYGDGVNVAARLEAMAEPGGVLISGGVYEQIKNKLVCGYQSLGDEKLKNITDPVHIYKVLPDPAAVSRVTRAQAGRWVVLAGVGAVALVGAGIYGAMLPNSVWQQFTSIGQQVGLGPQPPAQQTASAPPVQAPAARPPAAPSPPVQATTRPAMDRQPAADAPRSVAVATPEPPRPARAPDPPDVAATFTAPPAEPPASRPAPTPSPVTSEPAYTRLSGPTPATSSPPASTAPASPPQSTALLSTPDSANTKMFDDGKALRDCDVCPEMIRVRAGTFRMGSNDDPSEQPIHSVTVRAFILSRYPVTNREWRQCFEAKACRQNAEGPDDSPVRNVSWTDAQDYAAWLSRMTGFSYRLPTEAEWEYAARAGTITRYWWGDRMAPKMANCRGCGEPYDAREPLSVGSTAPNPFGLHAMGGSVAQWVADCWYPNYQGAPTDGSARNGSDCAQHVLRGGSWRNSGNEIRPASRARYESDVRHPSHGFRIARSN